MVSSLESIAAESDFHRQNVGGARRQYSERNRRSDHPVDHFVDGAVTTGGEYQIGPLADTIAGQRGGVFRAVGGLWTHAVAVGVKDAQSTAKELGIAPQFARMGIINQEGVAIDGDGVIDPLLPA